MNSFLRGLCYTLLLLLSVQTVKQLLGALGLRSLVAQGYAGGGDLLTDGVGHGHLAIMGDEGVLHHVAQREEQRYGCRSFEQGHEACVEGDATNLHHLLLLC